MGHVSKTWEQHGDLDWRQEDCNVCEYEDTSKNIFLTTCYLIMNKLWFLFRKSGNWFRKTKEWLLGNQFVLKCLKCDLEELNNYKVKHHIRKHMDLESGMDGSCQSMYIINKILHFHIQRIHEILFFWEIVRNVVITEFSFKRIKDLVEFVKVSALEKNYWMNILIHCMTIKGICF